MVRSYQGKTIRTVCDGSIDDAANLGFEQSGHSMHGDVDVLLKPIQVAGEQLAAETYERSRRLGGGWGLEW